MSNKITLIDDICEDTPQTPKNTIIIDSDKENLSEIIIDLSIPLNTRIKGLETFFEKFGEETVEIVSRLSTMYQFSGTKILKLYLYRICEKCKISTSLKITAATSLCYFNPHDETGYQALDIVCKNMKNTATPRKIEAICLLMTHKKFKIKSKNYFCKITNDQKLDCDYRYKTILSLENKNIPDKAFFLLKSFLQFFNNQKNRTLYRIIAGQYLIQKCKINKTELANIELSLMGFAQDPDLDYNLRADSADVILRLGSDSNKITAREIIMMLGRQCGDVKTIFDNAQNVHIDEIEQSVLDALEFLSGIEMKTMSGTPGTPVIDFQYVKKQIDDILDEEKPDEKDSKNSKLFEEKIDKIHISLNRIYLDRALYSKYNCSLLHILLKIWTYLTSHDSEQEMRKRLLEELVEMSGTCSSGFASRLVNVISGFGDFNFRISWKDQIVANFSGRLNARARDIINTKLTIENGKLYKLTQNICTCCKKGDIKFDKRHTTVLQEKLEKFQGNVLEEMTINSNDYAERKNFLKFFRNNMLSIRQELYQEFKEHIPDSDFDLYFRVAISTYETGGYV